VGDGAVLLEGVCNPNTTRTCYGFNPNKGPTRTNFCSGLFMVSKGHFGEVGNGEVLLGRLPNAGTAEVNLRDQFREGDDYRKAVILEAARVDFGTYVEFVHGWESRPHQRAWIEALNALIIPPVCYNTNNTHDGASCFLCRVHKTRRLLIVAFRGGGKSRTLIEFNTWAIGNRPQLSLAFVSYSQDLARARTIAVRSIIGGDSEESRNYKMVFPEVSANPELWGAEAWNVANREASDPDNTMVGYGMTGTLTGRRFSGLTLDDPYRPQSWPAEEGPLRAARGLYDNVLAPTLKGTSWQVCITSKWAEDDMAQMFMERGWPTLRTPAVDDFGEAVWGDPEYTYPKEELERLKEENFVTYMLQYQGTVVAESGERQLEAPQTVYSMPGSYAYTIQSWDTAEKPGKDRSETVCITMARGHDGRGYILDVYSGQPPVVSLPNLVLEQWDRVQPQRVLIEEASSGSTLVALLRQNTPVPVKGVKVGGRGHTKEERVKAMAPHIKSLAMPHDAPWASKLKTQINGWPFVHRDDILMALVQGCEELFPTRARGRPPVLEMRYVGW
jgi:phage terminase large subunit-like protein